MTDTEFEATLRIKTLNSKRVRARLVADQDVGKFLNKQAAKLGRPVTMGEFEAQIDAIYARHGF